MSDCWDKQKQEACKEISSRMISLKPFEESKDGLNEMKEYVISLFLERGFHIDLIENPDAEYRPVIVANLNLNRSKTVGFFGHYDVEKVDVDSWSTDPWELTEKGGRWQGRGVADNIVPLVQRILLASQMSEHVNLVFVLQGEEEIGSPFAMKSYPNLKLPKIDLWVEETGYFYKNGDHRIMSLNVNRRLKRVFLALEEMNRSENRGTKVRIRSMNKAFGNQGCPCLVHLLKDIPYIALGPNDDHSKIHGIDESMNPNLLDISARQLMKTMEVFSSGVA